MVTDDALPAEETPDTEMSGTTEVQPAVDIAMTEGDNLMGTTAMDLATPTGGSVEAQEAGAFNITHRGPIDASMTAAVAAVAVTPTPVPPPGGIQFSPTPRLTVVSPTQPAMPSSSIPRYLLDRPFLYNPQILASMPREEDVLMSLQLLAYVSKYCNLRSYFQNTHLVPRLKIGKELALLDEVPRLSSSSSSSYLAAPTSFGNPDGSNASGSGSSLSPLAAAAAGKQPQQAQENKVEGEKAETEEEEEEYLLPDDFNIFPLVEKFTVRYHSTDMQYWAGVVMRNLCRKDDTKGGIRQCAYYQCGKWEEYPRQFAKCRRCRRTKYCSKECQKSAWAFHRHWCVAAAQ